MTVSEYHDKFAQLSRYAPNEVREDADKQCLFLKGIYYDLRLQLVGNTYPNFQALVNRAIVINNMRKEMDRRGGCKDMPLGATLINVLVHSRDSKDQLVSGIVDHILSVLRVRCNKEISASIFSSVSLSTAGWAADTLFRESQCNSYEE
jgi:hypothetical protein